MNIHPSAVISQKAKIADDVQVGAGTIITDNVVIGKGTVIGAHCVIDNKTTIGERNKIFTGAIVGSIPQDLKYKGEKTELIIGNDNVIREYCTLNIGTVESGKTTLGNGNLLMAYAHVAHDCAVGNGCIIANNGTLAGHVTVEDRAVVGGLVAIHQFSRIGKLSIIGGCSKVVQDVLPFSTCDGHPAKIYGLNLVGLRRAGVNSEDIKTLGKAFRILLSSGFSIKHAVEEVQSQLGSSAEIKYLVDFIKNSQRGICHSSRKAANNEE
jgi:UDP-N-acetylglucosamine acyltransferase